MQRVQPPRNAGATVTDALYLLAAAYCAIAGLAFVTLLRMQGRREWQYVLVYAVVSAAWGPVAIHRGLTLLARRL